MEDKTQKKEKLASLIEKVRYIQERLSVPKSQFNQFGKYNYRNCEDILEAVKPLLSVTQSVLTLTDTVERIGTRYYVKAVATIRDDTDHLSVCAYARESKEKKGMDASQITGSASSYARKYALNGLLAIDDAQDADSRDNREVAAVVKKKEAAPVVAEPHASEKQLLLIDRLFAQRGISWMEFAEKKGITRADMTLNQASVLIKRMLEHT